MTLQQGKEIFQWGEKFVDIATLEKAVYEAVLFLGRNIMRQCIEEADRTLARQRDRGMYRDKGYRPTALKTVMGEVEYRRHVYHLSGSTERPRATVYLLDKSMGLDTVGFFSDTVCMMAVEAACAVSYRTAATTLNDLTGLKLSHESVWRIVQSVGSWEQTRVDALAAAAKAECGAGSYETPVLYEEMDGVYLTIIGNRMKHNRTCWSVAGANNLAALLALHHTGHLRRVLRDWTAHGDPSSLFTVTEPLSAAETSRRTEDVYIPPHLLSADGLHPAVKHCLTNFFPLSEMPTTN